MTDTTGNAALIAQLRSNADAHHEPEGTERRRAAAALEQSERDLAEAWDAGAKHGSSKCLFMKDGDPCPQNPYRDLTTGMNTTERREQVMTTAGNTYTSTTDEVRKVRIWQEDEDAYPGPYPADPAGFDRWLVANSAAIRAAALEEAALIADSMVDDEGDGYYGQACVAVAAAIRAAGEGTP